MENTHQTLSFNEHLELEMAKHPDRSYVATLLASQPQFSPNNLQAEIQAETEYWMSMLNGTDAQSFLQTFEGVQHAFEALKHEASALKDIEKAIVAHGKAEWAEAGTCYGKAVSDLHFALTDWSFAIHQVADDTPFDPYYPTKAEREKHQVEDPPRASYQDMCTVSPYLSQHRPDILRRTRNRAAADHLSDHLHAVGRRAGGPGTMSTTHVAATIQAVIRELKSDEKKEGKHS